MADHIAFEALPPGFCKYWDSVFIKANGRVPCGCDHGEIHTLVDTDLETADFVMDVLNGPDLRNMRVRTALENRAFIDNCRQCAFFKPLAPGLEGETRNPNYPALTDADRAAARRLFDVQARRGWPLGSIDWLSDLHLEPSLPCTLRCPGCPQGFDTNLLRREGPPFYFPLPAIQAITRSLKRHEVKVRRIGFGGRGEPTLNPRLPDLIRSCRDACPDANMEMDTNAQHRFKDEFLLLDTMQCSIDGSTQGSYETYRIGGSFDAAQTFLQAATERKRALRSKCRIVWKYILFDTTESVELIDNAQRLASDLGVDELLFVITWMAGTTGKVFPPKKMKALADVESSLQSRPIFPRTRVKYA